MTDRTRGSLAEDPRGSRARATERSAAVPSVGTWCNAPPRGVPRSQQVRRVPFHARGNWRSLLREVYGGVPTILVANQEASMSRLRTRPPRIAAAGSPARPIRESASGRWRRAFGTNHSGAWLCGHDPVAPFGRRRVVLPSRVNGSARAVSCVLRCRSVTTQSSFSSATATPTPRGTSAIGETSTGAPAAGTRT